MGEARAGGYRRWLWLGAGVVVLALVVAGVLRALTAGASAEPAAPATVAADRGEVTIEVATTGTLQPAQTRGLAFAVAGTVEKIAVRPGATVTPGQELATVENTDAAAAVTSAREALDNAEDTLTKARSDAAAATKAAAATTAPSTTAPASRAPGVPATQPQPQPQPEQQGQDSDGILGAEQRVTKATTDLAKAEDALAGATITAPLAGKVLAVEAGVGDRVGAGTTVITLADVKDMRISAAFPEADADRLAVKQKAAVTLADRDGETFTATVVQVDPAGTSDGTMVRFGALLSFDRTPADLLVGQSAAVRVTTGSAADVLRLPSTAVHDVAGTTGTVRRADGTTVSIGVGLRGDTYTEVTGGLTAADLVLRSW